MVRIFVRIRTVTCVPLNHAPPGEVRALGEVNAFLKDYQELHDEVDAWLVLKVLMQRLIVYKSAKAVCKNLASCNIASPSGDRCIFLFFLCWLRLDVSPALQVIGAVVLAVYLQRSAVVLRALTLIEIPYL